MEVPKRRRQNTIGVRYIQGSIIDDHHEEIIENKLGLKDEDIKKIEQLLLTMKLCGRGGGCTTCI